jgi:hypothetical protein
MCIISQIKKIFRNVVVVPKRFPLSTIAMVTLFALSMYIISHDGLHAMEVLGRYIIVMLAFFSLGTAVELWSSVFNRQAFKWWGRLAVIVFVGIYFFLLPKNLDTDMYKAFFVSQVIWHISFLLLIFLLPFLNTGRNKKNMPFYRQSLYTTLYIALGFAFAILVFLLGLLFLGALDTLFNIYVDNDYEYWWAFCATIVGPTVVLANLLLVQKHAWGKEVRCPKTIWSLANFILIPFVALYFIVLYVYIGEILVAWQWPNGRVSWLVLAFSVIGWLTYVFIFVWRRQNKMFHYFVKIFPWVALPQVMVLFFAWWWRVSAYGVTMNRYFLGAAGVWLAITAVYVMLTKKVKIIVLPVTLFVVLLIISFGPWSAVAVSEKSQLNRLQAYITKYQLVDSKGDPQKNNGENLSQETRNEISSIIRYIVDVHSKQSLEKILPVVVERVCVEEAKKRKDGQLTQDCSRWSVITGVQKSLGVDYKHVDNHPSAINNEFNFSVYSVDNVHHEENVRNIKNYDFLISSVYLVNSSVSKKWVLKDEDGEKVVLQANKRGLQILVNEEVKDKFSFFDLSQLILDVYNTRELKREDFKVVLPGQYADVKIEVQNINGKYNKDGKVNKVEGFTGSVMVRLK